MGMSRRQALATIASTTSMSVAAPAMALAAASAETESHVAWWRELVALRDEANAVSDAACHAWNELPEDLKQPARVQIGTYREETGPGDERKTHPIYAETIDDIDRDAQTWIRRARYWKDSPERIAQEEQRGQRLREELTGAIAAREEAQRTPWGPLSNRASELWQAEEAAMVHIIKTPARTLAGVVIKMRVAWDINGSGSLTMESDEFDMEHHSVWNALQDADRLAGTQIARAGS
jgi:hypothetical protein